MSLNILVTGTNSGFGRLTALALARRGHHVFATMRDIGVRNKDAAAELRRTAEAENIKLGVVEMEATSDASVNQAVAHVLEKLGHLDVVVNNAGAQVVGLQETATPEQLLKQYDLNVVGPHRLARAALPSMRARGQGLILNVSSELARWTLPFLGSYCGTKAALESTFEAYAYELKPLGVEVTFVQPGAFPTDLSKNAAFGTDAERAKTYGPMENGPQQFFGGLAGMMTGPNAPNPQDVADAIVSVVEAPVGSRPRRVVVDKMMGQITDGVNKAHGEAEKAALGALGLGNLA
jgi:NAD(P)-dependent dehydrogenase (short-subunit alcohol dehydrogenase family)